MELPWLSRWQPQVLALLRIVAGLLFIEHATVKFWAFPAPFPMLPLTPMLTAAGVVELVAGDGLLDRGSVVGGLVGAAVASLPPVVPPVRAPVVAAVSTTAVAAVEAAALAVPVVASLAPVVASLARVATTVVAGATGAAGP